MEFPEGLERSSWARLGCSPVPMTTVSFLPPPPVGTGLFPVPRQAWLLAAVVPRLGKGCTGWGCPTERRERSAAPGAACVLCSGTTCFLSVPKVGCDPRSNAGGSCSCSRCCVQGLCSDPPRGLRRALLPALILRKAPHREATAPPWGTQ